MGLRYSSSEYDPCKSVLSDVSLNQVSEPEDPLCVSVLLVHSDLNEGLISLVT